MPVDFFQRDDAHILNIDHHHDNTRFGTANLVVGDASCTAEILYTLLDDLGVELNPKIAEALYVALVTDTGRFQYENTTAVSHRMAADLIEAGVDVHGLFRQLYENVPLGKVLLMGRVLTRVQRFDGGRLTVSYISREDYEIAGSDESLSEGIVDHIRALDGTLVAALVREQLKAEREGIRKVSLRAAERLNRRQRDRPQGERRRPPPGGRLLHGEVDRRADCIHPRRDRGAESTPLAASGSPPRLDSVN